MNFITILLWITIAIIAAIAIIAVKLHYRGDELELEEGSILPSLDGVTGALSSGKEKIASQNNSQKSAPRSLSPQSSQQQNLFRKTGTQSTNDAYIVHEVEDNNLNNYNYETQNQVLINYDNSVERTQEPMKQSQIDIMTQNKPNNNENEETSELKDLFTIDELIKESKRKDSERERESQTIKHEEDRELEELKQSIKNKSEEPLIEEVGGEEKEETISDLINDVDDGESKEIPSVASQKDVDEAITAASQETEEEIESISESESITDALINQEVNEEIAEPALKTPSKVGENKDYKLGASIDDANLFGEDNEEEGMDLDYRKDLDKVKNKITGSKIFKEVKEKFTPETIEPAEDGASDETFIRNVNEYEDEYAPIINETYIPYEATYEEYHDERLRQENTKKVFNMAKKTPEPELAKPKTGIKSKPSRNNIKITLNNEEALLKKGDEIIFTHQGETYSSQVYAINGDDISVKYRRKNIKIKPEDVKKIY
jgi:hypothetical protein